MKLGILQCDSVDASLQPHFGDYPDFFMRLFKTTRTPLTFSTYPVFKQNYPPSLDECDAYLITGSKDSVYEKKPWIRTLQNFITLLHLHQKKLIGICFGHQLIAQALGGRVEKSEKGWGVGVSTFSLHQQEPWMSPPLSHCSLAICNQDQVITLPKNAVLLAGNDFCPHAMFRVESHILTCQAHPEFPNEYARILIEYRKNKIGLARAEKALQSLAQSPDNVNFAKWLVQFIMSPQLELNKL